MHISLRFTKHKSITITSGTSDGFDFLSPALIDNGVHTRFRQVAPSDRRAANKEAL